MSSGVVAAVLVGGGAAVAHIEPNPGEVQAGAPATVEFLVEHGCDDADTTGMLFEIPANVTDLQPVAKEGWTTTVEANTVAFTDGVLDHDTEDTFALAFTAPSTAGTIDFPLVQQCGDTELRWIEIAQAGAIEPEHPAPRVLVVGEAPPASTTTTAAAATTTAAAATTTGSTESTESTVAATTAPLADSTTTSIEVVIAAPDTTGGDAATATEPDDGDDDGSSSTAWVVIAVIVVAAAGGAFVYWSRSRSAS